MTITNPEYLTRAKSADFLTENGYPIKPSYLAKLAIVGGSPTYQIFGNRALYRPEELLSWAKGRLSKPLENSAQREANQ